LSEEPRSNGIRVEGACDASFSRVHEAFRENFSDRGEVGAAVCVVLAGVPVVDLWGGFEDAGCSRPWLPETRVNVFSVGKGMLAVCLGLLVERLGLDLDAPVARYWPEFREGGKEEISVRCLASHRAGLPALRDPLPTSAMFDWDRMVMAFARERPWWEPDQQHGYHVNSLGFLLGELVRRVSGQSVRDFFATHVALPSEAEVGFGAPRREALRVADCLLGSGPISMPDPDPKRALLLDRVYSNPPGISGNGTVNSAAWREAELPSANAHATARGVARVYASLLRSAPGREQPLLDGQVIRALTTETSVGMDCVLARPSRFGVGFQLTQSERPLGPNTASFGHFGAGGALGFADPDADLAFAYVMNLPGPRWQNPRTRALLDAVYASL